MISTCEGHSGATARQARGGGPMRRTVIAAWMLVAALFVMMTLAAHLPAREPVLPPGVRIPAAVSYPVPADPACAEGPTAVAESAC